MFIWTRINFSSMNICVHHGFYVKDLGHFWLGYIRMLRHLQLFPLYATTLEYSKASHKYLQAKQCM